MLTIFLLFLYLLWWNVKTDSSKINTFELINTWNNEKYSGSLKLNDSDYKHLNVHLTFAPPWRSLPSRNMTARSYSWTTCIKSIFSYDQDQAIQHNTILIFEKY